MVKTPEIMSKAEATNTVIEITGIGISEVEEFALTHPYAVASVVITGVFILLAVHSHSAAQPWTSKKCRKRLDGKTVIVTGATGGVGKEVAHDLARRGARLILPCRDEEQGLKVSKSIQESTHNQNVVVHRCDLGSSSSIKAFVNEITAYEARLDILINCADSMSSKKDHRSETEDGFEHITAVKYFGHFLLTNLLLDLLKKSSPSRIINVVCLDYCHGRIDFDDMYQTKEDYNPWHSHFVASLEMIMFTREFGKRFKDTGVTANMVQPGNVDTKFGQMLKERYPHMPPMFTHEEGARTVLYCALEKGIEQVTGSYFTNCTQRPMAPHAQDDQVASRLWDVTRQMVGLK